MGEVRDGVTVSEIADTLLEVNPKTPLVCDLSTATFLMEDPSSISWREDGHLQVVGRPKGVLDVYYAYKADSSPNAIGPGIHKQTYRE